MAPATTAQPLTLTVRSVAIDGTAIGATTSTASLIIPFEDRPAAPSLTVLPSPSASEDQSFALSEFVTLNPGSGRSADTATLYIRATNANLTSDIQVVDGLGSSASNLPTAQIDGKTFYIVKADSIATSYLKTSTQHFKTSTQPIALEAFARDTASNNLTADSAISKTNLKITALADGVEAGFVTTRGSAIPGGSGNYDIDFAIGSDTTIYDPRDATKNLFAGIKLIEGGESYGVQLVFKATPADAVAIKIAGKFVIPQTVTETVGTTSSTNLVYAFSKEQLTSQDAITLIAKDSLFGKSVIVKAFSIDGASTSSEGTST